MEPSTSDVERQPTRKSTLYCTTCDHANRINGDWIIRVGADRLEYECPECGSTIDTRRDRTELTARSGGALQFGD